MGYGVGFRFLSRARLDSFLVGVRVDTLFFCFLVGSKYHGQGSNRPATDQKKESVEKSFPPGGRTTIPIEFLQDVLAFVCDVGCGSAVHNSTVLLQHCHRHSQSTPDATRRTEHTPLEEAQLGVRGGDCEAVRRCWHRSVWSCRRAGGCARCARRAARTKGRGHGDGRAGVRDARLFVLWRQGQPRRRFDAVGGHHDHAGELWMPAWWGYRFPGRQWRFRPNRRSKTERYGAAWSARELRVRGTACAGRLQSLASGTVST